MRALGLGTKIASACAAALAILVALGLPWYDRIPDDGEDSTEVGSVSGSLDNLFEALPRVASERAGMTAWDAFATADTVIAVLAGTALLAALLCTGVGTEQFGRGLLQLVAFAVLGVILLQLLFLPDGMEPRYGAFVALGCAVMLFITAGGIATMRLKRRAPAPGRYHGTPTAVPPGF